MGAFTPFPRVLGSVLIPPPWRALWQPVFAPPTYYRVHERGCLEGFTSAFDSLWEARGFGRRFQCRFVALPASTTAGEAAEEEEGDEGDESDEGDAASASGGGKRKKRKETSKQRKKRRQREKAGQDDEGDAASRGR